MIVCRRKTMVLESIFWEEDLLEVSEKTEKLFEFNSILENAKSEEHVGFRITDILDEKDGRKIGIQTKRYSSKVSNTAVQEVVAGLKFYNCDEGVVIINNYFTDSAIELAEANNIVLWDRDMLIQKIDELL